MVTSSQEDVLPACNKNARNTHNFLPVYMIRKIQVMKITSIERFIRNEIEIYTTDLLIIQAVELGGIKVVLGDGQIRRVPSFLMRWLSRESNYV